VSFEILSQGGALQQGFRGNAPPIQARSAKSTFVSAYEFEWIFKHRPQRLQECGARCTIDNTMITRHRNAHAAPDDYFAIFDNRLFDGLPDCQDRALGRVNDRGEFVNAEHAEIADRKGRADV